MQIVQDRQKLHRPPLKTIPTRSDADLFLYVGLHLFKALLTVFLCYLHFCHKEFISNLRSKPSCTSSTLHLHRFHLQWEALPVVTYSAVKEALNEKRCLSTGAANTLLLLHSTQCFTVTQGKICSHKLRVFTWMWLLWRLARVDATGGTKIDATGWIYTSRKNVRQN